MLQLLKVELVVMFLFMSLWFCVALKLKRNDVADIVWGLGFIVATISALFFNQSSNARVFLVSSLIFVWGSRLTIRILLRNIKKSEDPRYKAWREGWGDNFKIRTFLQIFMLQGFLILIISTPVLYIINSGNSPLNFLDLLGTAIWLCGFFFEVVGDYQLDSFKKDPANKGRIMKYGLWRYSRHPNYFGEVLMWWGIFCIALSVENGWFTVIGPGCITFLILKVSGIPLAEKRSLHKDEFQHYMKKTSAFFPMPPKKEK
jgi:steroid 5-alpha reductase family enzyme